MRVRRRATNSHGILIYIQYAKPNYRCSIPAAKVVGEAGRGFLKRLSLLADSRRREVRSIQGRCKQVVVVDIIVFVVVLKAFASGKMMMKAMSDVLATNRPEFTC